jgi:hypothetical protein
LSGLTVAVDYQYASTAFSQPPQDYNLYVETYPIRAARG